MDSLTRQYDKLIGSSPYPLYYANIKFNTTAELKSRSYVGEGELILIHRWFAVDCRIVAAIAGPLNLHSPKPKILQCFNAQNWKEASSHPRGTLSQPVKLP
jgi:hypothetical protein